MFLRAKNGKKQKKEPPVKVPTYNDITFLRRITYYIDIDSKKNIMLKDIKR